MSLRTRGPVGADELRVLVAPTALGDLLLPSAAVAEVVSYAGEARMRQGGPAWLVGDLDWRGQRVPLVDLGPTAEADLPSRGPTGSRRQRPCALICFSPSGNRALPYIAILVADSPRLVRLGAADLHEAVDPPPRPFALYALAYQGRPAWVPDLDLVERQGLLLGLLGA